MDGKDVTRGLRAALTSRDVSAPLQERGEVTPLPAYHFGVYARVLQDGQMLCVRKTRGPYTGLLDLPGGRPEFAETWEAALRRELQEEVGADHVGLAAFERFALHVQRDSRGEPIDFHHHGALADVRLCDSLPANPVASSDTSGWLWFDLASGDRSLLSPLARWALSDR